MISEFGQSDSKNLACRDRVTPPQNVSYSTIHRERNILEYRAKIKIIFLLLTYSNRQHINRGINRFTISEL